MKNIEEYFEIHAAIMNSNGIMGSCQRSEERGSFDDLSSEFKDYWYSGVAELNSYEI